MGDGSAETKTRRTKVSKMTPKQLKSYVSKGNKISEGRRNSKSNVYVTSWKGAKTRAKTKRALAKRMTKAAKTGSNWW